MKTILKITLSALTLMSSLVFGAALAGDTAATALTGSASFATQDRTYVGSYSTAKKSMSVDIDGLTYKGHYASNAEDSAALSNVALTAGWGRAFLFASSAKTLQCQLDAGFPDATGQCLDAQGRVYRMNAGAFRTTLSTP